MGLTGRPFKMSLGFLGEELGLSIDVEESRAAWLLLRLVSGGHLECLTQIASRYQWIPTAKRESRLTCT
jgi:hypothetical protein